MRDAVLETVAASDQILSWFRDVRLSIPIGESDHKVPGLPFDLTVHVDAMEVPDTRGGVVVGRVRPKDKPFSEMLGRALDAKLPKLVAAPANQHILLLEDGSMVLGLTQFATGIDEARVTFPNLEKIDSIWLVFTAVWDSENVVFFFHVWPDGVRERFKVGAA
jgi:hypothetical protein